MTQIAGFLSTAYGYVDIEDVHRYFRDDEWTYFEYAVSCCVPNMFVYSILTDPEFRHTPHQRAWFRANNVADFIARQRFEAEYPLCLAS